MKIFDENFINKVVNYNVYKKMFTPYEYEKCFVDETEFSDSGIGVMEKIERCGIDFVVLLNDVYEDTIYYKDGTLEDVYVLTGTKSVYRLFDDIIIFTDDTKQDKRILTRKEREEFDQC